ncbi:MAG: cyclic nucleotide-binding domain-containing protein [Acidimicrobiia bacterium]
MTTATPTRPEAPAPASVWHGLGEALDVANDRPRVRGDLLTSRLHSSRGDEYVVVQNPDAATYLRMSPQEFELLELMDGSRTVKDLVVEYMLRHRTFALAQVTRLVADLRNRQFLVQPPRACFGPLRARLRGRRVSALLDTYLQTFLHRQFPVPGFDALVARIWAGAGRLLFARPMVLIATLVAAVGMPLFVWQRFVDGLPFTIGGSVVPAGLVYYGSFVIVAGIHELCHALAVKRSGRVVRKGGFMILYGAPGLYVDTQDIWMEPRRARLVTSWAGPFSGFVLTGLAGVALLVVPDGNGSAALAMFGVIALLTSVVQLMPLIELDGYYALMDWLDMPNLRRRAFEFVRRDCWAKLRHRQRFDREERILAVFGVLAGLYTGYALIAALLFAWARTDTAVRGALRVPDAGRITLALVILLLTIPLGLAIFGRLRRGAQRAAGAARRMQRLGQERWYRERVAALSEVPALAALGKAQVQWLARRMRAESFRSGSSIVRQGVAGQRFCVIVSGEADVVVEHDGEPEVVARLGPLDYVGEQALLDQSPCAATVRAVDEVRVLSLGADDFHERIARYIDADAGLRARLDERAELDRFSLFESLGAQEKDLLLTRLRPPGAHRWGGAVPRGRARGALLPDP